MLAGILPWISWDYVHAGFDTIFDYRLSELPTDNIRELWASTLYVPIYGFLFFLFFGVSGDAFTFYARWWEHVAMALSRPKTKRAKSPINHEDKSGDIDHDPESFEAVSLFSGRGTVMISAHTDTHDLSLAASHTLLA